MAEEAWNIRKNNVIHDAEFLSVNYNCDIWKHMENPFVSY